MSYALIADLHACSWSAFSSIDKYGVNSRLQDILGELDACCRDAVQKGHSHVVIAGDLFHVRGSVSPSVFNPVKALMNVWVSGGITFSIIPGNHDLESDETTELGSSVQMLAGPGITIYNKPTIVDNFFFVPWIKNTAEFLKVLKSTPKAIRKSFDVICHVGINGTLKGLPDHGINAGELANLGYNHIFAGHYHAFKDHGKGVVSIGAATHQTWSDVGSVAGHIIVGDNNWNHVESQAPKFIDLANTTADSAECVQGNFVRANIGKATKNEIEQYRQILLERGAAGVVINSTPNQMVTRNTATSTKSINLLDKSIADYITEKNYSSEVGDLCMAIFNEAVS